MEIKNLDKEKLELIKKMLVTMNNKSEEECLQILFTYGMEIKSKEMSFTSSEIQTIYNIIKPSLKSKDTEKLDMMLNIFQIL